MFPVHTHRTLKSLKLLKILNWQEAEIPVCSDSLSQGPTDLRLTIEMQEKLLLFSFQLCSTPEKKSLEPWLVWLSRFSAGL